MDRIAIYSLVALAAAGIGVFAIVGGMAKTNTLLIANADRIEVRGCTKARPFQSSFDREAMSASYRIERYKRRVYHELVLEQKGQRTVEISLGNHDIDSKLVLIAPDAMKLYEQKLKELGERVPLTLQ